MSFYILAKILGRETYPDMSNTMGVGACVCVRTALCLHFALRSAKPRGATFVWGTLGVEYSEREERRPGTPSRDQCFSS